jgi:hypothetical protein
VALPLTRLARWRSVAASTACKFPEQAVGDITLPDLPHGVKVFVQPWQKKDWLVSIPGPIAQCFAKRESQKSCQYRNKGVALNQHAGVFRDSIRAMA